MDALSDELIENGDAEEEPRLLVPKRRPFGIVAGAVLLLAAAAVLLGNRRPGSTFLSKKADFTQLDSLREYGPLGGVPGKDRPCGSPIQYSFEKILHNNFGGVGPDSGAKIMKLEAKRHDPLCKGTSKECEDKRYILEVHCLSDDYVGTPKNHNGLNGTMALIGLKTGNQVDIEFKFFDLEGNPAVPETFPMTWFDIDGEADGSSREFVIPHGDFFPFLEDGALIDFEASPGIENDGVRYISHTMSGLGPNPDDPYHLTKDQKRRVVGFEYKKPKSVRVTIGSMPGPRIRLFSFSMMSVLKPCADVKQEPFKWWWLVGALAALLLLCCLLALCMALCCRKWRYRYRLMDVPVPSAERDRQEYAKNSLKTAFDAKDAWRYRCALELALDADVPRSDIPMVFQVSKFTDSFMQLGNAAGTVKMEVCFVLDYTGSMGTQIKEVINCLKTITQQVQKVEVPHRPGVKVALSLSAVAYNDFDEKSRSMPGVPVVSVFGGREIKENHSPMLSPSSFNLGGRFTTVAQELNAFVDMKLGHGGAVPEEMTGALIAASHLPWSAEYRLCFVITDAPCHGKDYHATAEDTFVDSKTGLSCSGRPEIPLRSFQRQKVDVCVLHTGSEMDKMLGKFREVMPRLKDDKIKPAETSEHIIKHVKERLKLQPLGYDVRVYDLDDPDHNQAPAVGHQFTVSKKTVSNDGKSYKTDSDGLAWVGFAKKEFGEIRGKIDRPDDVSLDKWWTKSSNLVDLPNEFKEGATTSCDVPIK